MALPTNWFQTMADGVPGHLVAHVYLGLQGSVHPYYVMIALLSFSFRSAKPFIPPASTNMRLLLLPRARKPLSAPSYVPFLLAKLLIGTFFWVPACKILPGGWPAPLVHNVAGRGANRHNRSSWLNSSKALYPGPRGRPGVTSGLILHSQCPPASCRSRRKVRTARSGLR